MIFIRKYKHFCRDSPKLCSIKSSQPLGYRNAIIKLAVGNEDRRIPFVYKAMRR